MKKRYIVILAIVIILFSIILICTATEENNRSVAAFSQNNGYKININTATVEELTYLPGIGTDKAEKIVEYRENRRFKRKSDIMNVRGIGESIYKEIKDLITV